MEKLRPRKRRRGQEPGIHFAAERGPELLSHAPPPHVVVLSVAMGCGLEWNMQSEAPTVDLGSQGLHSLVPGSKIWLQPDLGACPSILAYQVILVLSPLFSAELSVSSSANVDDDTSLKVCCED